MIRNGDVISGYTVMAVANGIVLAHSETAPDPFVVWYEDPPQRGGVSGGSYQQTIEDAEWDFCCKAFPWFEDNAPVNMIEDEAQERIDGFKRCLEHAKAAIDSAAALVEDMVAEHSKLEDTKEAPQEESSDLKIDYVSSINIEESVKIQSSVSDCLAKIKDQIKKSGIPCTVIIDNGLGFDVIK